MLTLGEAVTQSSSAAPADASRTGRQLGLEDCSPVGGPAQIGIRASAELRSTKLTGRPLRALFAFVARLPILNGRPRRINFDLIPRRAPQQFDLVGVFKGFTMPRY